jgi:hypothetical protein
LYALAVVVMVRPALPGFTLDARFFVHSSGCLALQSKQLASTLHRLSIVEKLVE